MSALAFARDQTLIDLPEFVFIIVIIVYVFIITVVGWTAVSVFTQRHLSVSCIILLTFFRVGMR